MMMMKTNKHFKYNNSVKGIARQLRSNHGYSKEDSYSLAKYFTDDYCCCRICGIPVWLLRSQFNRKVCSIRNYNRQTVDHINPNGCSTLSNTRPLCNPCNVLRGPGRLKDIEVLRIVRKWWRDKSGLPLRFLFWLNKIPNQGGTIWRNEYMMNKDLRLRGIEPLGSGTLELTTKLMNS